MWLNSMGWFGKLSINCSRHAVPHWEMDKISFWYTANFLGNILFAGKQYLATGWICCSLLASGGDWGQHSSLAGHYSRLQSPFSSCPSILCKVEHWGEPKRVPPSWKDFQSGRGRLEHFLTEGDQTWGSQILAEHLLQLVAVQSKC